MAIYIKFLELNYTIEYFRKNPYSLCSCVESPSSPDVFELCTELLPYCTESERRQLEQIQNLFQSMEMYREMSRTMEMMKDFMPDMASFMDNTPDFSGSSFEEKSNSGGDRQEDSASPGATGGFDMMNILMNMLTPEQKQMFEMFGGNQHAE